MLLEPPYQDTVQSSGQSSPPFHDPLIRAFDCHRGTDVITLSAAPTPVSQSLNGRRTTQKEVSQSAVVLFNLHPVRDRIERGWGIRVAWGLRMTLTHWVRFMLVKNRRNYDVGRPNASQSDSHISTGYLSCWGIRRGNMQQEIIESLSGMWGSGSGNTRFGWMKPEKNWGQQTQFFQFQFLRLIWNLLLFAQFLALH